MLKRKISVTFAVIAMILLVQACRKFDFTTKESKTPEFTVAEAKEWYYGVFKKSAGYKQVDLSSPFAPDPDYLLSSNTRTNSTFFKKYPYWNKAIHYSSGNIQVVEMPVAYEANILVLPGMQKLSAEDRKKVAASSLQKILFIKNANQSVSVRMVTLIPSLAYLKSKDFDISDNTMQNPDKNFDGVVVIRNWQEKIINVIEVKDAKYTRKIKLVKSAVQPTNPNNTSNNIALRSTDGCGWSLTVRTVRYCISTTGSSGDQPPADPECPSGDWGEYQEEEWEYVPCEGDEEDPFQDCIEMGNSNEQCSCDIYGLGCGGEGDQPPGDDPSYPVSEIDNLVDPCLRAAKNKVTNENLKNFITQLYNTSYLNNTTTNISWNQVLSLPSGGPAQSYLSGNTWTIEMSTGFIQNNSPSQEFVGAVMLHEVIHSFIQQNQVQLGIQGTNWADHSIMFFGWTNKLRDALKEIFNLDDQTATALALGGIADVLTYSYNPTGQNTAFGDFLNSFAQSNYNISLQTAQAVQNLHMSGLLGTDCN